MNKTKIALIIFLFLTGTAYAGMTFTGMIWEYQSPTDILLLETGDALLLEAGDNLLLE
jgi:hypothetical protein